MQTGTQTVLVTGACGYIGAAVVFELLENGFSVLALDSLLHGGESLLSFWNHPRFRFQAGDVRETEAIRPLIERCDAVVHLAAIVGDPACKRNPDLAWSTNFTASQDLIRLCQESKRPRRFVFGSTCSNYGRMEGDGYVSETSALNPVSLYAKSKTQIEQLLLADRTEHLAPVILRFATAYGLSPRMRFDLTVNEFVLSALDRHRLQVYGENFWRPYCHVADLARACRLVLEAPPEKCRHEVFGVGATSENYTKRMIAGFLLRHFEDLEVEYVDVAEDPRDYRVDFGKIKQVLGFESQWKLEDGILEIRDALRWGIIQHPREARYRNS